MPEYDVVIVGGGPAGSTAGVLLKKYCPALHIAIFERETFPRDHVGESQLPAISAVLNEMGCWDKVERAGFPIKVGATYKWGKSGELWDFDFVPPEILSLGERPGRYEGHRRSLAFQVDRAVYDKILLDHARELGCEVFESTRLVKVERDQDRVASVVNATGDQIVGRWFVDASGHAGLVRRAMDVKIDCPTNLKNIAIWAYWRNAEWAEKIGVGATRVQVISVRNGWIWFIPLQADRTSVGLVTPAEHFKRLGRSAQESYFEAIGQDDRIAGLVKNARIEREPCTTKDWSFLAERHCGENWLLAGESGGFADPILAAGLTITHAAAREAAFTILEAESNGYEDWLREAYDRRQSARIKNHIQFADYWYTANEQFTDLQEYAASIARGNGLDLSPGNAWAWLAQGGFIDEELRPGAAGFDMDLLHDLTRMIHDGSDDNPVYRNNVFALSLSGTECVARARYEAGRVLKGESYERAGKRLPIRFPYSFWLEALSSQPCIIRLKELAHDYLAALPPGDGRGNARVQLMAGLDAMIQEGWVTASRDEALPLFNRPPRYDTIHAHLAG